ncbi:type II toxin-antitoxin system RelE/ParE family toxin [Salmonella enterica]|uniref:type II toxin-antitoxin system RelE/ParE family toxin n=1 Tax=Salmonella enterica TaxID=28901 RepID=UPI002235E2B6|nr:type II toxin-antitoxin system RelE/ParE family toxin [Salmonella enterica]
MRTFKTRWFNREAKPHTIKDDELSEAINAVLQGSNNKKKKNKIQNVRKTKQQKKKTQKNKTIT